MKTALITGITGQDGAYLSKLLLKKNYKVFGAFRRLSTPNFWRMHYLNVYDKVTLIPSDIQDSKSISEAIKKSDQMRFTIWRLKVSWVHHLISLYKQVTLPDLV